MNGIIGTAELMRDTALKPQHEQGVATIIKSSHALLAIIKDILDFSKIETKGLVLTRAAFFLPDIVQDVAALLRPVASTNGVIFRWNTTACSRLLSMEIKIKLGRYY